MVIVMKPEATKEEIKTIIDRIEGAGLKAHVVEGEFQTIIGVIGDKKLISSQPFETFGGVDKKVAISASFKLVSRAFKPENTVIDVDGIKIGDGSLVVMAGPCAVESQEQILEAARIAKEGGAQFLRGGAYKPRTSPYAFQGLEEEGLKYLAAAREATGLKIITEVTDVETVELVASYADVLQIGARNMQNFKLLRAVGRTNRPVMLKRGLSATMDEWLNAAEYIMSEGNHTVILCERGIRTYETYTRNTLDLAAIGILKHLSHLPVIVDPSHGTGKWRLVKPMAMAAVAAGTDGIMVEMHPHPEEALSDGAQSLTPEHYLDMMKSITKLKAFLIEAGL